MAIHFKFIFGGKNQGLRCRLAHLLFIEGETIYSAELDERLNVNQATANRVVREFIKLALVDEVPITKKGIRSREARYYQAASHPAIVELAKYSDIIKMLAEV